MIHLSAIIVAYLVTTVVIVRLSSMQRARSKYDKFMLYANPVLNIIQTIVDKLVPIQPLVVTFGLLLLLSPIIIVWRTTEACCAYVVLYMALLWVLQVVPLAITALVPIVAFPLLGVDSSQAITSAYLSDSNFVLFSSMIIAGAAESVKLHERVALKILQLTGSNPRLLMMGFQVSSCFLSMWISNTATTAMMVPISHAVILELERCRHSIESPSMILESDPENAVIDPTTIPRDQLRIYKGFLLSIAFAATIGGSGTLIGTGANIVLSNYLEKSSAKSPITFFNWILFALPLVISLLIVEWLWLQAMFVGWKKHDNSGRHAVQNLLNKKYEQLGPMRYEEKTIIVLFVTLIFLWVFRRPDFFAGWSSLFTPQYVTDGTVVMAVALLLFVVPSKNPFLRENSYDTIPPIMTWPLMRKNFSWSTLLLVGGGFAIARGVRQSGLSDLISNELSGMQSIKPWLFVALSCILVTTLTEFSSNVATASVFIPMVHSIAVLHDVNPLYYMLPVTLSSTYVFLFPTGTPPNAIVFATRMLTIKDMLVGGVVLNVAGFFLIQLAINTWGHLYFNLGTKISL